MQLALGIDVGGTNTRGVLVGPDGKILQRQQILSESRMGRGRFVVRLKQLIDDLVSMSASSGSSLRGIGIGLPGILDSKEGILYASPHFEDWKNWKVREELEKIIGRPLLLDNDANFAALGESWKGAGRDWENFLMLTLGTGIGGGIVIGKKLWRGDRGFAGEFGHIVVESEGVRCFCGGRGCLEMYASATGLKTLIDLSPEETEKRRFLQIFERGIENITVEEVHNLARDGNIFAVGLLKRIGYYLGIGVATLVNAFGLEKVILGGGIAPAWDFFIGDVKKEIARRTYRETASKVQIAPALLGNDAGILGAASAVFSQ
ncbi:MAG: ROK family protein [Deltaproteobacteria bacterium]|nr:ROK family protein [Deltaproteobacteria bacterium]